MTHQSLESLHADMVRAIQIFTLCIMHGDARRAAFHLNRYHQIWDTLESLGMDVTKLGLPSIPPRSSGRYLDERDINWSLLPFLSSNPIKWGQHNGFTNVRGPKGSTIFINSAGHPVNRMEQLGRASSPGNNGAQPSG